MTKHSSKRRITRRAALGAAFLVPAAAALAAAEPSGRLTIERADAGDVAYSRGLADESRFELSHTHSITKLPVYEVFSVHAGAGVAIEEMRFNQFGANLPVGPEVVDGEEITTFEILDDGYRVGHGGRLLPELRLIAGAPDVDHLLSFPDGEELRLLDVVAAHQSIIISYR